VVQGQHALPPAFSEMVAKPLKLVSGLLLSQIVDTFRSVPSTSSDIELKWHDHASPCRFASLPSLLFRLYVLLMLDRAVSENISKHFMNLGH
jgi:hypothetical protein